MSKVRVYEVARELGLENRELLHRIHSLGIQVRNHMSALDPAEVDRVRRALEKDRQEHTVEERIRKTVIRRRSKKPLTAAAPLPDSAPAPMSGNGESRPAAPSPTLATQQTARATTASSGEAKTRAATPRPAVQPPAASAEPVEAPVAIREAAPPKPTEHRVPAGGLPAGGAPVGSVPAGRAPADSTPAGSAPAGRAPAADSTPVGSTPVGVPMEKPVVPAAAPAPATPVASAAAQPVAVTAPAEPSRRADPAPPAAPEARPVRRPSQPPPASERLAHANLPPGVVARGKETARGVGRVSDETKRKIIAQHGATAPRTPRRVEVNQRDLGQTGRRPTIGRPPRRPNRPIKKGQKTEITVPSAQKRIIKIEDHVTLQVLAQRMSLKATQVLMKLVQMGMTNVTINSTLDSDTASLIASEFNYEVENVAKSEDELIAEARGGLKDVAEERVTRSPIVTVMGHVDHGKTSLLDRIRKARVAAGEAGGITQHIGAYRVETTAGPIVFLDTPGHEAFTSMRARGAQATDVVVLVVAADDGVKPQTREAVNHAKAAEVPIIVAVNKIDKPDAKPEQVRQELVGLGLQPEEWGGDTLFVDVSAITGDGVDTLLESIALQSEMLELSANPNLPAEAVVLEAYLDRGRGPVANVLVRNGTLRQGDYVLAGTALGKVRALTDERGRRLKAAGPATPVEVLGLSDLPSAGDMLYVVQDETAARSLADDRRRALEASSNENRPRSIEAMLAREGMAELNLVIKSDVHGSVEALVKALTELSTEKVEVKIIHTGVGGITENDVMLASASNAIIIGFNVRPAGKAGATAKSENVEIRSYRVIYEAVDEVRKAMAGLLAPEYREKDVGKAEVRQVFSIPRIGTVAGCYVTEGKVLRNAKVRLVRDSVMVWEGDVGSLRRFKDDVREVSSGYECGIGLAGYNDIKPGDMIECYELEQIEATI